MSGPMHRRDEKKDHGTLTEFASKALPMSPRGELVRAAHKRYEPGTGPWQKEEMLDQIDLVHLEEMIEPVPGPIIKRLVEEVRRARNWPTPPDVQIVYEHVEKGN